MNFIGKIFVVLVFIMSIIFMWTGVVVYATHRNWEDLAKKTQAELAEANTQFDALQSSFNRLQSDLESQLNAARQQVAKLQTEQGLLVARNTGIQQELDQLKEQRSQATAAVASTQEANNFLAEENNQLRGDIRTNQAETDQATREALAATEELNQIFGQLESATERNGVLSEDVARMKLVLQENGIDPATSVDDVTPRVDGFVSAVRRTGSQRLIEVTIGADDGLRVGHKVEIFRGRKYLGRAQIFKTDPDKAVGQVDPRFLEGRIQEGDRVATRLKLS